jgi:hypothetical protein
MVLSDGAEGAEGNKGGGMVDPFLEGKAFGGCGVHDTSADDAIVEAAGAEMTNY